MVTIITLYCLAIFFIIAHANHKNQQKKHSFLSADQSIGPWIMVFALFATSMSALAIVGGTDQAYYVGLQIITPFALAAPIPAGIALSIIGKKIRHISNGQKNLSQHQLIFNKTNQSLLAARFFTVCVAIFAIPFLIIGIKSSGDLLHLIAEKQLGLALSPEIASAIICFFVFLYLSVGGILGASWVNTLQAIVFLCGLWVVAYTLIQPIGGVKSLIEFISEHHPQLLKTEIGAKQLWLYLSLSTGFVGWLSMPHFYAHFVTAKDHKSFSHVLNFFPLCALLLWIPVTMIGFACRFYFPEGSQISLAIALIAILKNPYVAGLMVITIFAVVMSTLDSQLLSMASIFKDVLLSWLPKQAQKLSDQLISRILIAFFLLFSYVCSVFADRNIFSIGLWSSAGMCALTPLFLWVLYSKQSVSSKHVIILTSCALFSWLAFLVFAYTFDYKINQRASYTILDSGITPSLPILLINIVLCVIFIVIHRIKASKNRIYLEHAQTTT